MPKLLAILRKANSQGRIGYAHGGKNKDLPLVLECERRGWIKYLRDASPGPDSLLYGQRRDIYCLTPAGRKVLNDNP